MASDFIGLLRQGGIVIFPLLLASVVSVALIIERAVTLLRAGRAHRRLHPRLLESLEEGGVGDAVALCRHDGSLAAAVYREALAAAGGDAESRARRVQRRLAQSGRELKRFVWLIGTIGSLAPFIGLLGTVIGIVRAFENMATTGSGGFAVVAAGISEALIATAAGLLIGVICIFAYNALMIRIGNLGAELRDGADELFVRLDQMPRQEGSLPRVVQSR